MRLYPAKIGSEDAETGVTKDMTTPEPAGDKRVAVLCPFKDKGCRVCIATHCIRRQCMAMQHRK